MACKRIGKRSLLGTRVAVCCDDGKYVSGVIQNSSMMSLLKSEKRLKENKIFVILDESKQLIEASDHQIVGPGFKSISSVKLQAHQTVYVTHNGREVGGKVHYHRPHIDEVVISIQQDGANTEIRKKLEEVRLWESRKSARLQDNHDQDYARLADIGIHEKRNSSSIDVPNIQGSRKRRTNPIFTDDIDTMDDCTAAMVLMSLSCSPKSPRFNYEGNMSSSWQDQLSPLSSSGASSWYRSQTPSPPLEHLTSPGTRSNNSVGSYQDEGISLDEQGCSTTKILTKTIYQCTWPGCGVVTSSCTAIERHVRKLHLGPKEDDSCELSDHEEEFYYTEIDVNVDYETSAGSIVSSPPTLSHMDMARPPHEDPQYMSSRAAPISIPQKQRSFTFSGGSCGIGKPRFTGSPVRGTSNVRRPRSDIKKCRKVYGIENRELWCTQCKWKKACTRFLEKEFSGIKT